MPIKIKTVNVRNLVFCSLLAAAVGRAAPGDTPANFDEVYGLLRNNLHGVSQADLDRAALKGLLEELPGQATLVEKAGKGAVLPAPAPAVAREAVYDDAYAYVRVGSVEGSLPEKFRAAYQDIVKTNKSRIRGVVLDLRFASGADYAAAAGTADCFLNSDRPLLEWGTGSASATKKADAIDVPVAVLVNSQTRGAAEALAAALREASTGLILGDTTAGQANIFKEFPLSNGDKLRIAVAPVKLGDGTALARGLKPDIAVDESVADARAYLDDPYKVLHPAEVARNESNTNSSTSAASGTSHRTNEAELVRERREGDNSDGSDSDGDSVVAAAAPEQPAPPVMGDSALARALDLLKGLAVLQQSHPG